MVESYPPMAYMSAQNLMEMLRCTEAKHNAHGDVEVEGCRTQRSTHEEQPTKQRKLRRPTKLMKKPTKTNRRGWQSRVATAFLNATYTRKHYMRHMERTNIHAGRGVVICNIYADVKADVRARSLTDGYLTGTHANTGDGASRS